MTRYRNSFYNVPFFATKTDHFKVFLWHLSCKSALGGLRAIGKKTHFLPIVLLRRQKGACIKKRRRVWIAKQYVICTVYFKSTETSNRFLVMYKWRFTGSEASWSGLTGSGASRMVVQVGSLGKVMLGTGVVVAARLPELSTAGKATRQSVCGIGYRLPGPLVQADHLHCIKRVDGIHNNPN